MQIYILYACKSDKKIKKLLIFFVLFEGVQKVFLQKKISKAIFQSFMLKFFG